MQALLIGVLIRLVIVAVELYGYICCGSSALKVEAISTGADLCSSLFLLLCVFLADRSPDKEHPFGHGRYEPLGGLQLGLLILLAGILLAGNEFQSFLYPDASAIPERSLFWIPLAAVGLLELGYRLLIRVARREDSTALAADAWHFRIDAVSSVIALCALLAVAFFPLHADWIDHLGAFLIALFMVFIGAQAMYENLQQILDGRPEAEKFELVRQATLRVEGVQETEKIRLQVYGPDAHVAIDIEVDPHMVVDEAHRITQKVRREIQEAWPAVRDVIVHVEPYYPGDH
jgi:cation diffusion facilitator family transporter